MSDSEPDEYDAYFTPLSLNPEDLDAIQAAEAKAFSRNHTLELTSNDEPQKVSNTPPSPDEFDAYDLSEFSAEDFAHIDKLVRSAYTSQLSPILEVLDRTESSGSPSPLGRGSPAGGGGGITNGGPRIEIALEDDKKADPPRRLKDSWVKYTKRSPYQQFRSWNRLLSVTDIANPSWCEVQFDYGLRQGRYKKLADRPASFTTAEGKTITVSRQVAAVNDRTVTRGRSVHKVLERETRPEMVRVEITTNEERWALRLVNMLTALQTIMGLGRCREMPVFGFINDQIVTGIIDEVVRQPSPMPPVSEEPEVEAASRSPSKRPAPRTAPSSPAKPSSKKICPGPPADQPQLTAFFSPTKSQGATTETAIDVDLAESAPVRSQTALPDADEPMPQHTPRLSLHLSDTKTRTRPTLPPEEDTFASRIQLMLYHRLLSNLLSAAPAQPDVPHSSQPLDFGALWRKAGVDPTRRFSDSFLFQAGLSESQMDEGDDDDDGAIDFSGLRCLNDLTRAWGHAVEALNVVGVDKTLTLVYRAQPTAKKRTPSTEAQDTDRGKDKIPRPSATSSAPPLSDQEARDIAAAIQASISDVQPGGGGDDDLARAIFESLRESIRSGSASEGDLGVLTHPFGPPISDTGSTLEGGGGGEGEAGSRSGATAERVTLADDPQLAWALQQSLLARLEETPTLKEALSGSESAGAGASSGVDDSAVEFEDAAGVVGDETGVVLGKLAQRAATEGPEGAAPRASSAEGEDKDEDEEMISAADLETVAKILGTKEFELDNEMLDEYLARVLAWWYGDRKPEGVDVELTRRCVTCEYRDGCEWREKKAQEALQKYQDRSDSPLTGPAAAWL